MANSEKIKTPWALAQKELFSALLSEEKGLTQTEAQKRLIKFGKNEISREKGKSWLKILAAQFANPLIFILIAATAIAFFLGEKTDAAIILAIVVINGVLGFFQEFKAEKAVRELRKLIPLEATVLRNGEKIKIDSKLLVPGDIVFLNIGDIVPADMRLLKSDDLTVDESSLTGESAPVLKNANVLPAGETLPQNLKNMAFMGTHAASGEGFGIVTETGEKTFFGKTAAYLKEPEERSDFEKSIAGFSKMLLKIVLMMAILIFAANALLKQNYLESFLFALALAVGITPESLPIIITISLSRAAQKLAKAKVIVKKLSAVEDIGNMDILCTDKTGTLTEGRFSLDQCLSPDGKTNDRLLVWGLLCNDAVVSKGKAEGNIIDRAIWESNKKHSVMNEYKQFTIIDENEFDFERRRMSVIVKNQNGAKMLIVKGALESITPVCGKILLNGKTEELTEKFRAAFFKTADSYRKKGYSIIAVAIKEWTEEESKKEDEKDLTLAGFLTFLDPPRESAKKSLQQLKNLGVKIKVLSGDDPFVTQTICEKVGLQIEGKIYTGEELDKLNDQQFAAAVEECSIFARITPGHKYRIVKTLNKGPEATIGFMGDGINDAPALKASDVGISVNTATSIAKEAADIILMEKDLDVVAAGVREGRRIFANITKYIINTVSANYGNMFTVAVSSVFLKFIPLLPSQILLNNLLTDTPMLTIASDNVDEDLLKKPRKLDLKMISGFMRFFGFLSTFFDLSLIFLLIFLFKADQTVFQSAWFLESALSEIAITFSIRTQKPFYKSKPGKLLFWTSAAMIPVLFALFAPNPVSGFFHFTKLNTPLFGLIIGIIIAYFAASELVKRLFFKKYVF